MWKINKSELLSGRRISNASFIYPFDIYTHKRYNAHVIKSFADKETEKIYHQEFSRKIPQDIQKTALRKLMMIDAASRLDDLKAPPGNRLEALSGDRAGQWSIRINSQWRICFVPSSDGADYSDVTIADYH
jgi:proteic killer suppression protein